MFAGNYAPEGWALCAGQLLPIAQHEALFALIGTTYGGDGQSTFALPDLRGRIPLHMGINPATGTAYHLAQSGGAERVTLTHEQLPAHTHVPNAQSTDVGTQASPENAVWASAGAVSQFTDAEPDVIMSSQAVLPAGAPQPQPHENRMPYLAVSFIIALNGIFPTES